MQSRTEHVSIHRRGSAEASSHAPPAHTLEFLSRRGFMSLAAATGGAAVALRSGTLAASTTTAPGSSGYAPVNGLEMYYEVRGEGDPLVLVHGAFDSVELWEPMLSALTAGRQAITVDLQGHGRTADIDRPFGYDTLAEDVAGLMQHLEIAQADVAGYSMGANTALQVAIRHPELVRKLVAISPNFRYDGEYPEVLAGIEFLSPEIFAGTPVEETYLRTAPDPAQFPVLIEKLKTFLTTEFAFPEDELQSIAAPAFIAVGDSDTVRPEHAVELFRLLGGGVPGDFTGLPASRLAILPATTHASIVSERADQLASMIQSFLDDPISAAS